MADNRIDVTLTEEQRTAITDAVATIRTNLPFLVGLSPEERQALNKLGPKSRSFAQTALTVARQNADVLPAGFDVDDFAADLTLYNDLEDIFLSLERLYEEVSDTRMLAGSEAMFAARAVLYYVRGSAAGDRLDEAAATLGERFAGQGRRSSSSA